jgi:hypothetical protein
MEGTASEGACDRPSAAEAEAEAEAAQASLFDVYVNCNTAIRLDARQDGTTNTTDNDELGSSAGTTGRTTNRTDNDELGSSAGTFGGGNRLGERVRPTVGGEGGGDR